MAKLMCANAIVQFRNWARRAFGGGASIRSLLAGALLTVFPAIVACDRAAAQPSAQDFDRLCEIYEEISTSDLDGYAESKALLDRIDREVPEIYRHYEYLAEARPGRVYELLQDLATDAGVREWECGAVESYYRSPHEEPSQEGE